MYQKLSHLNYNKTNFAVQLQNYLDKVNTKINHFTYKQQEGTYLPLVSLRAIDSETKGVVIEPLYRKHTEMYPRQTGLTYQALTDLVDLIPIIKAAAPTFVMDVLNLSFSAYKTHAINRVIDDFNNDRLRLVKGHEYKVIQKLLTDNAATFEISESSYHCFKNCSTAYRDKFIHTMIRQKNHAHHDPSYLIRFKLSLPESNEFPF